MHRQKWQARLQAVEIVNTLIQAMGGKSRGMYVSAYGRRYTETTPDGLMAAMGARWQ